MEWEGNLVFYVLWYGDIGKSWCIIFGVIKGVGGLG